MNEIIKKNGVTYGIIIGVVAILISTIIYAVDLNLFLNSYLGIGQIVIYVTIGVLAVAKTKRELGKLISFKEAFTTYFMTAAIGTIMSVLFSIILFNYIDPDAKETLREIGAKFNIEMMEKFGQKPTEEMVEKIYATDNYTPANQLMGLGVSLIISAIFGLIIALIFRNKTAQPE